MTKGRDQQGFTLVEALVAFAVLAVALGAAMPAISRAVTAEERTERTLQAVSMARSRLAEVGATIPLEPGVQGGSERGMDWSLLIESRPEDAPGLRAFDVQVRIRWDTGSYDLAAIRLQPDSREVGNAAR